MTAKGKQGHQPFTQWGYPTEQLDSQYGRVHYLDWCEKERDRINPGRGRGQKLVIVHDKKGRVALDVARPGVRGQ